jgi:hypothetical protein
MIHDRPPKGWRRPAIPLATQVAVLKRALCVSLGCDAIELDHRPALWERSYDDVTDDTVPSANDPAHLEAIGKDEHRTRTSGTKATSAGSDAHRRAKVSRLNAASFKNVEEVLKLAREIRDKRIAAPNPARRPAKPLTVDDLVVAMAREHGLLRKRPMPGSKASGWKKKMSGKVERR